VNRVVVVAISVIRAINEILRTRKEIIELVDRVARLSTTVRCGDVYIYCDVACCTIGDRSSQDKLTLRDKEPYYAELEVGGRAPQIISLRKTSSKTAKRLLREADKCVDELEKQLREIEARLETLKQMLAVLRITYGAESDG
jgi:hypothetical protein